MKSLRRLHSLFRKGKLDAEMQEEMRLHVEMQTQRNITAGMGADEARYAALRQFGNVASLQERARDARGWTWLVDLVLDFRRGSRALRKQPGYALVAILTVSIGIGANLVVADLYYAALLRPLPGINEANGLAIVGSTVRGRWFGPSSYPQYSSYRDATPAFSELAAYGEAPLNIATANRAERIIGEFVSGNYFQTLRLTMAAGRAFRPEEDVISGRNPVAVISDRLWEEYWQRDPALVGRELKVNGVPVTVVGVAAPGFRGVQLPTAHDVWVPLHMRSQLMPSGADPFGNMNDIWLTRLVGRLAPGATIQQADSQVAAARRTLEPPPDGPGQWSHAVVPYSPSPDPNPTSARLFLALLGVVTSLVFVAVAANGAGVILSRGVARQREIAMRFALGASRIRVVREQLVETSLVVVVGAAIGLVLSEFGGNWIVGQIPGENGAPPQLDLTVDWRVAATVLFLILVSTLAMGLLPAWRGTQVDLLTALKSGAPGHSSRSSKAWMAMIVTQVAFAFMLLVAAGLMMRTLEVLSKRSPAVPLGNVLVARVQPAAGRDRTIQPKLLDRIRALSVVDSAGMAAAAPFSDYGLGRLEVSADGAADAQPVHVETEVITPGYFPSVGLSFAQGRDFFEADAADTMPVVIVNRAVADRLWPKGDAVGRFLHPSKQGGTDLKVVGVVEDASIVGSTLPGRSHPLRCYVPQAQQSEAATVLVVRAKVNAAIIAEEVRATLHEIAPDVPLAQIRSLREARDEAQWQQRVIGHVSFLGAVCAALIAMLGLYAAVAQDVVRRRREIGIRMAIGARGSQVSSLVVRQAVRIAVWGVVAGLAGAWGVTRVLRIVLVGISPTDPAAFAFAALILASTVMIACWLPARQATRVNPVEALRAE